MKKITILATLMLGMFLLTYCAQETEPTTEAKPEAVAAANKTTKEEQVKRGAYLVNAIGCDDCHSPKKMGPNGPEVDPELRLSGHPSAMPLGAIADKAILKDYALFAPTLTAAVGPWGTSFAANLTPDDTGIGNWSEAQFLKAIREGKYKGLDGSRPLLPPMPWFAYRNLNDEDLKAIFAYLQTLPPIKNVVPAPIPPAM